MPKPYHISWYLPDRALLITIDGDMDAESTQKMEAESFKLIKEANDVVHAIVDLRYLGERPPHISQAFTQVKSPKHPNQGVSVIIVPMNPVVSFITSTVMAAMKLKVDFCNNFAEAEAKIAKLEKKRGKGSSKGAKA